MRLLYVAPFLRIPPDYGAAIRAFHLIRLLAQQHHVSVITYASEEEPALAEWAREHLDHLEVLAPAEWGHLANGRLGTLRRMLRFPPESFRHFPASSLRAAIEKRVAEDGCPDAIILDTLMTGQAALDFHLSAPLVLSLYDFTSTYLWRLYHRQSWRPYKFVYALEWFKTMVYERHIVRSFRTIVVVSRQDAAAVKGIHPSAHILCVPNGVDTHLLMPIPKRRGDAILFVGDFDYAPNAEGLWYFYEQVWPKIRSELDAQFLVVGLNPPAHFMRRVQGDSSVRIQANVPDVRPFYEQARLCVVPLLNGGGTRLKILEAFSLGVPVVSTSVGCEGLDLDSECLLVADTPDSFAEAVIRLYRDDSLAQELARNARRWVETGYDWRAIANKFESELAQIVASRQTPTEAPPCAC